MIFNIVHVMNIFRFQRNRFSGTSLNSSDYLTITLNDNHVMSNILSFKQIFNYYYLFFLFNEDSFIQLRIGSLDKQIKLLGLICDLHAITVHSQITFFRLTDVPVATLAEFSFFNMVYCQDSPQINISLNSHQLFSSFLKPSILNFPTLIQ